MDSPYLTERALGLIHGDPKTLRALEDRLKEFCDEVRSKTIDESDEHGATRHYVAMLAEAGLLDLVVPAAHGGANEQVSATQICLTRQWLARESGALDTAFVMQGLGSFPLVLADAAALAEEILPSVRSGATICGFAITEPEAGSDVSNMTTTARLEGDEIQLDGMKWFISNAGVAHGYSVFARELTGSSDGPPTYSAFWVPS
ncbi:MAG: acyl-CoA dehydrogenase family protein, partial [Nannocystaceae bacterium]